MPWSSLWSLSLSFWLSHQYPICKILPYTDVNLFDFLRLYLLELALHHSDVTVRNPRLNDFKQFVCFYLQLKSTSRRQAVWNNKKTIYLDLT
jgi:hypothetical protein